MKAALTMRSCASKAAGSYPARGLARSSWSATMTVRKLKPKNPLKPKQAGARDRSTARVERVLCGQHLLSVSDDVCGLGADGSTLASPEGGDSVFHYPRP